MLKPKNKKNYVSSTKLTIAFFLGHPVYKQQCTDKTLTFRQSMCMRESGASELGKFSHFHILKLLFLSIFCWYFRYFVGTNDMFVGLHVPTNFQMYRQRIMGGGGGGVTFYYDLKYNR